MEKAGVESLPEIFSRWRRNEQHEQEELTAELYLLQKQLLMSLISFFEILSMSKGNIACFIIKLSFGGVL